MARLNNSSIEIPENTVSRNSTGSGRSTTSSQSRGHYNTISQEVINSPAYQSALQVFSNESDKSWLQRLELIPYSVSDANSTFLDDIGFSNKYEDKQNANYQYCMEQIQALMAEYQSWKNSLPTTQVQQLSDAGINSAITGQGVSGSTIPNVGVSSDPSTLQSTSTVDFISAGASFILDSVNGLASIVQSFRNLGLQRDSQLLDFYKFLRENGISLKPSKPFKNLGQLLRAIAFPDPSYPVIFNDPKGDTIRHEAIVEKILTNDTYAPLFKRWSEETFPGEDISRHPEFNGIFGLDVNQTNTSFVGVDAITDAEYEKFLIDTKRAYLQNRLSLTQTQNEIDLQEKELSIKDINKQLFDLHLEEMKIKIELINTLRASDAIEDKLLLQKILLGYNATDQNILSTNLDYLETEKELGILGKILNIFD